jgi:NlpC/P60 family putative phage cell wall peptidase
MTDNIITAARGWLGTPYLHQASLKGVGCDCLGLIRGVWREIYGHEEIPIPVYSPDWAESSREESFYDTAKAFMQPVSLAEIQPGDLLLFRWRDNLPAKHCGILTDHDHFIHAHDGACVAEVTYANWWKRRTAFALRFPK